MAFLKLSLLQVLVAAVFAKNVAPVNLPSNAQDGLVYFPLECHSSLLGDQTYLSTFTGTLPVVGGLGQEVYYSEITSKIVVPQNNVTRMAHTLGITQASALVHADLHLTNASPSTIQVFPDGILIQNITIPKEKDIIVHVPGNGSVIAPVGPITLGSTKGDSLSYLGRIRIRLDLQNKKGETVLTPFPITCDRPKPNIIIGVVSVEGPTGLPPLQFTKHANGEYPTVPLNYEVGSFRFPYTCDFAQYGVHDIDLAVTGTVKTFVAPNENFYLINSTSFLRVSKEVVSVVKSKTPAVAQIQTTFNSYYVTTTHATPAQINALKSPIVSTNNIGDHSISIPIPEEGYLQIGPITASSEVGQTSFIGAGNANATMKLLSKSGKSLGQISVGCHPKYPVDFIGFPIVNSTASA